MILVKKKNTNSIYIVIEIVVAARFRLACTMYVYSIKIIKVYRLKLQRQTLSERILILIFVH